MKFRKIRFVAMVFFSTILASVAETQDRGDLMNLLYLDGKSGFVLLPHGIADNQRNATIEAWVQWRDFTNWSRVFDFGRDGNAAVVQTERNTSTLNFTIWERNGNRNRIQALNAVKKDTWHHIAAVCGTSGMRFYVDGKLVGQHTYNGSLFAVSGGMNYIGKSNWASDEFFHGYITEFRIWDKSRTESEILKTMYSQLSGNEDNLIAYWRFENAQDRTVNDLTNQGNQATLAGAASIFTARGPALRKVDLIEKPVAAPLQAPSSVYVETPSKTGSVSTPPDAALSQYKMLLIAALVDRKIDESERQMLNAMRESNGIAEEQGKELEREVRRELRIGPINQNEEIYFSILQTAYSDGVLTDSEFALLQSMKKSLGISDERENDLKKDLVLPEKPKQPTTPPKPATNSEQNSKGSINPQKSPVHTEKASQAETKARADKQRAEAEALQKAEQEAKQRAEAEALQKAQQEAKQRTEAEALQKAQQEAKQRTEAEALQKAQQEAKQRTKTEALQKAQQEAKQRTKAILNGKWKLFTQYIIIGDNRVNIVEKGTGRGGIFGTIEFKDSGLFEEIGLNVAGAEVYAQGVWDFMDDGKIRFMTNYARNVETGVRIMELQDNRLIFNPEGVENIRGYFEWRK